MQFGFKGEVMKRIREFEKLKNVSSFVTFLSTIQRGKGLVPRSFSLLFDFRTTLGLNRYFVLFLETTCIYDIYEVSHREKIFEARKPNRHVPCSSCSFCGCWNLHNFLSSRFYKEDVILLDNSNQIQTIFNPPPDPNAPPPDDFKTEILRLRSVIRFMDGTTVRVSQVCF